MSPMWTLLGGTVPVALMALLLYGASRISPRGMRRRRTACPLQEREATVDFVVGDEDTPVYADVVGCSLVAPGHEIECGKPCRSAGVAPFGTARAGS
jgi:hypothetical protein